MSQRTTVPGTAHWGQQNIGITFKRRHLFNYATRTSGAYVDGAAINRVDPDVAKEAIPIVLTRVTLASGESAVFTRRVQHRSSSADAWADYGPDPANYTVLANNDGSAKDVDVGTGWSVDLGGAKEEIRIRIMPTLSNSGVDTVAFGGSLLLAGFDTIPPTGA
jgi:hypothetical protein